MTPENFTYWLQGYFEISPSNCLMPEQVEIIKDHLDLVFNKVTLDRSIPTLKAAATYPSFLDNIGIGSESTRYC